jgi:hypothetical protein
MAKCFAVINSVQLDSTPNFRLQGFFQLDTGISDQSATQTIVSFSATTLEILDAIRADIKSLALIVFSVTLADSDIRIFPF